MAPALSSNLDYLFLIEQNCEIFLGPFVETRVITLLDSSKRWHAHLVRTERGIKTAVLSESHSSDLLQALKLLHEKTARAVDQHVSVHGFAPPPQFSTRSSHSGGEDTPRTTNVGNASNPLEHSEVIALCGSSSSEASDSDDSLDDEASRVKSRRARKASRVAARSVSPRRSRLDEVEPVRPPFGWGHPSSMMNRRGPGYSSPPVVTPAGISRPPPPPLPPPQQPNAPPPQPPQNWGMPVIPPPPARNSYPAPPMPPTVRPHPRFAPPKPLAPVPIRMNVTWIGHGSKKTLIRCKPTKYCIGNAAIDEVNYRASEFPLGYVRRPKYSTLRFTVRKILLGDDAYDVKNFGEDFSSLCGDGKAVLGVEVDVEDWEDEGSDSDREIVD